MLARVIAGSVCRASGEILSRGLPCAKKQDQNNRVHARAQLRAPYMVGRPLRKKRSGAGRFKFGLGRRTRTRKKLLLHQAASREELMKRTLFALIAGVAIAYGSAALGEMIDTHKVFLPQDIKWGAAPPSLPAGAEAAVLYGDPQKEGMFALRIKAAEGLPYRAAHALQTRGHHSYFGQVQFRDGVEGGPSQHRISSGREFLVDAARRWPLRICRRRRGCTDQLDRTMDY